MSITETSMYKYLMLNYNEKKDAVAMSFLHKKFTYGFLSDEIDRIACFLKNQGIEKGDRVTIALPNIPSAVSSFYAVNKIGAVANMVHPLVPYELLAEYMKDTGSKLLFAFDTLLDGYFDRLIEDGFRVVVCKANDYLSAFESFFYTAFGKKRYRQIDDIRCVKFADARGTEVYHVDADESFDDVSVIMHSSGTTEKSKSAALTNKNFNTIAENTIDILPWKKKLGIGMAGLTVLPMFHAFGLGVCIHTYLSYGYDNVLIPKYSPKLIIKKLRRKNIAVIAGVPTMFAGMVAQKGFDGRHLKKLRFAFCGGDKLSAKVKTKFDYTVSKNGGECPLDEGYGLTEAAGVFSVNTRAASREGSVGKALGDAEIHVFDENGNKLPPDSQGELCLSTDALMKGYINGGKISSDGFFEYGGKRYVRTGDWGSVDADGFIYFKQRIKRMEKVSGVNVFPAEAENVISAVGGVRACCVKGVPDNRKGTVLKAFVQAEEGADTDKLLATIKAECAEKLDKWTNPKYYEFIDRFPVTKFGKIDYNKL